MSRLVTAVQSLFGTTSISVLYNPEKFRLHTPDPRDCTHEWAARLGDGDYFRCVNCGCRAHRDHLIGFRLPWEMPVFGNSKQ